MNIFVLCVVIFIFQFISKFWLNDSFGLLPMIAIQFFGVYFPIILYCKFSKTDISSYFKKSKEKLLLNCTFSIITAIGVNIFVRYLNYPVINLVKTNSASYEYSFSLYNIITGLIFLCIVPSIAEELLFRCIMLDKLKNKHSLTVSILISSIIFAVLHFDLTNFIPQFIFGIVLCLMAISTKSIFPSILAHFLNNIMLLFYDEYICDCMVANTTLMFFVSVALVIIGVGYFGPKILCREI